MSKPSTFCLNVSCLSHFHPLFFAPTLFSIPFATRSVSSRSVVTRNVQKCEAVGLGLGRSRGEARGMPWHSAPLRRLPSRPLALSQQKLQILNWRVYLRVKYENTELNYGFRNGVGLSSAVNSAQQRFYMTSKRRHSSRTRTKNAHLAADNNAPRRSPRRH